MMMFYFAIKFAYPLFLVLNVGQCESQSLMSRLRYPYAELTAPPFYYSSDRKGGGATKNARFATAFLNTND
jgi:hypothetical protein